MKETVDIFILTYNRSTYLRESIQSVLQQTYENFRLIILDNHSEDDTREIVEQFNDERIVYICHEENIGGIGNINYAIQHCTSKYFVIFHDDDKMLPNMIHDEISLFEVYGDAAIVSGNAYAFNNVQTNSNTMRASGIDVGVFKNGTVFNRYMNTGTTLIFPSIMYKTEFIRRNSIILDRDCGPCADVVFYCNIERLGGTIYELGKPVMLYRQHESQDSYVNFYPMHIQLFNYLASTDDFKDSFFYMKDAREKTCNRFARKIIKDWLDNSITFEEAGDYLDSFERILSLNAHSVWRKRMCFMSKHISFWRLINKLYKIIKRLRQTNRSDLTHRIE